MLLSRKKSPAWQRWINAVSVSCDHPVGVRRQSYRHVTISTVDKTLVSADLKGDAMPLASSYSYPLLGAFWTILEIFLWVIWIWILIYVFMDIFRSHDLSGGAKALWFLFVLLIPLVGVLVYLLVRGGKMQERAVQQAQQQDAEVRSYIQQAAGSENSADQLAKLAD